MCRESFAIFDARGERVERAVVTVEASGGLVELGPYRHFMQKEIFEQPRAVADTLEGVTAIEPELFGAKARDVLAEVDGVLVLACGTSHYAGWWRNTGSRALHACPARSRSRASTAIATPCPIRSSS